MALFQNHPPTRTSFDIEVAAYRKAIRRQQRLRTLLRNLRASLSSRRFRALTRLAFASTLAASIMLGLTGTVLP